MSPCRLPALLLPCFFAPAMWCALTGVAQAQDQGTRGMWLARQGRCEQALPLLEESELTLHRPPVMLAMADCQAKLGDLLAAREIYKALSGEKPGARTWGADLQAISSAKRKARALEDRIPTVRIEIIDSYPELELKVDGRALTDPSKPVALNPNITAKLTATAKGYRGYERDVTLSERERLVVELRMVRGSSGTDPDEANKPKRKPAPEVPGTSWAGAHGKVQIMPRALMRAFADGGRTAAFPGAGIEYTHSWPGFDLALSIGATSYRLPPTPFKQKGAPDTDWELIDSTLTGMQLELDFLWNTPLDDAGEWRFRYGFGVGVGYMVAGSVRRTQAFPPDGHQGNPYEYLACNGPNEPFGTWAYCNSLDKDADHYRYEEPDWFHGGKRPSLYPWVGLPILGLTWLPTKEMALDLNAGFGLTGFFGSLGLRFKL